MSMQAEEVLGIIPARIGSTRIPGKMLKDILGKTLIQRTYERSVGAQTLDALIIATDSDDIERAATGFGAPIFRSILDHKNGTERAAEAARHFTAFTPEIVVIIWGDEPLYPAMAIDACVKMLKENPNLDAVTAADRITDKKMIDVNSVVKIVTDVNDSALYISRAVIPYNFTGQDVEYYHVIGAMAMRREFLFKYIDMVQTPLEKIESVEQLRILENGYKLGIVKGDFNNLGVNTPAEYDEVVKIFAERLAVSV